MKGDFTRFTFRPEKRYTGVRMQQGRVQLDADWNEQIDIDFYQKQAAAAAFIGGSGAPKSGGGFQIGLTTSQDLTISPGRFYVNGLLCELFANDQGAGTTYLTQADYPQAPALSTMEAGAYLVYLDVWSRHVTLIEDLLLREVALAGPDTTTRNQTIWQVKLVKLPALLGELESADFGAYLPDPSLKMAARAQGSQGYASGAVLPPGAGYQRLDNLLYRVEIHQGGTLGKDALTYKWSRDNGTGVAAWTEQRGTDLVISYPGRDDDLGFAIGNWVELLDDGRELRGEPGLLVRVISVEGNVLTIDPGSRTVRREDFPQNPKIRRWDMVSVDVPQVSTDGWLLLEDGLEIAFSGSAEGCQAKSGDYWLIPARTATRNVEWPQVDGQPQPLVRQGIQHYYAPLAQLQLDGETISNFSDRRFIFPSLVDLRDVDPVRFEEMVYSHQHTGSADGTQIPRGGIVDGAIDGTKIDTAANVTINTLGVSNSLSAGSATINGAVNAGSATITGAAVLKSTSEVAGAATFGSTLSAAGVASLGSALGVSGATTLSSTLTVADTTTLSGTLGVAGAAALGSTLGVTGATTLGSTLGVADATTLSKTLGVTGATTLGSTLGVTGATTLGSTLGVTGATTLSSTLGVTGATTLSGTLGVTGATTLGSTLGVSGANVYLDNTTARGSRDGTYRRALTHDSSDTLTLNYGGDYSSGVKITGMLGVDGRMYLSDNGIALRGVSDGNHGFGYFGSNRPFGGASVDGPVLYGYGGGVLGSMKTVASGVEAALVLSGGYVTLPAVSTDFSGGISIEAWVKYDSYANNSRIIELGNGSSSDNIILCNDGTTSTLKLYVYQGGTSKSVSSTSVLSTGTWMHIAATIDSTGKVTLYRDGTSVGTGTLSLPANVKRSSNYLGKSSNASDGALMGRLAHVRLWSRALTANEVSDHYNNNRAVNSTSLVAYWPLDDGTSTTARDKSTNLGSGTLSSSNIAFETYQYSALTWDGSNNVGIKNALSVSGNATLLGTLAVSGNTTVSGTLQVASGLTTLAALTATGAAQLKSTLAVTGSATFSDTVQVTSGTTTLSALIANGTSLLKSTLGVTGAATFSDTVTVSTGLTTLAALTANGAAQLKSTLAVTGSATFSDTVTVSTGLTTLAALTANGAAQLKSTLAVTGSATFSDTVTVSTGLTTLAALTANGAAQLKSTLAVTGATTLTDTLTANAAATLKSTLAVTGAATLSSTLAVTGAATLSSTLAVAGASISLDNTTGRNSRAGTSRRALYHESSDFLTMNYAGDYSSGVKISGQLTLDGRMALGDNMIAIRNAYDCNHGLSYFGSDTRPFSGTYIDGPGLYGYAGGALGTVQTAAKGVEASLVFAGTSGYMSFPAFTEDFTAGITIEAWVYFSSMSNDSARIIDMGNGQANDNIVLFQEGISSSLKFVVYTSGNSTYYCTAANVITTGAWMHLALTMDSTGAKIYKNGVAQTVTTSGTASITTTKRNYNYLAKSNWSTNGYFQGKMAQVRLWKRALTADEISDRCDNSRVVSSTGLVAWWPMDEGGTSTTTARDRSGNSHTGTLSSSNATFEVYQKRALSWDSNNDVVVYGSLKSNNVRSTISKSDEQKTTSTSYTDLANMSLTVTLDAGVIFVLAKISGVQNDTSSTRGSLQLLIDGTTYDVSTPEFSSSNWGRRDVILQTIATVTAGSHTVKVQWCTTSGTLACCNWNACRVLTILEL